MFELTQSTFMVGAVSALLFGGTLVLALWTGWLSDRYDRRKVLIMGRTLTASSMTILALAIAFLGVDGFGGPPILLLAVTIVGIGVAVSNPAMQAIIPGLVPKRDLEQALALGAATPSIARTVGPAVGAGLLAVGGYAWAFGAAAATDWIFTAVLFTMPGDANKPKKNTSADLLKGIRYLVSDRRAGLLVLAGGAVAYGADPVITLVPELADQMGGGSTMVGVFVSSFGLGAVLMALLLRKLRRMTTLRMASIMGFWWMAGGLLVVAASRSPTVAATGFFVAGVGFLVSTTTLNTRIQWRVEDHLRGRVMALWGVAFLGTRPLASLANGAIAELGSLRIAVVATAVLVATASLLASVRYPTDPIEDTRQENTY